MKKEIYLDENRPIEERVNDLIKRMTIDEKINQMFTSGCNDLEILSSKIDKGESFDIGATFVYHEFDPETYNKVQKYQIETNRLKIPFILASENTHGVSNPLCTIYPTTGCMAATFDEKLIGRFASASAREARTLGITQFYAPNVDISWDLRWGRVEENFGEDPYLTSKIGTEIVKGFQKEGVAATVKHYIAYGLPESGLNLAPAHIGERDIREYMLPPFESCIKKGKAWGIMPSYNEVDGEPVHASKRWMKDVLRGELGFDGMVMTDYGASNMLRDFHKIVDRPIESGKILCDNEVDMEGCSFFGYNKEFRELVKSGKYPISKVDKCVKNILRLKFRLGLFENPYAQIDNIKKLHAQSSVKLSKEIADKGIVLLKNDGVLPLEKKTKVALIGPNADVTQLGNYIYYGYFNESYKGKCVANDTLTLKQVFEKENVDFSYAQGCLYNKTDDIMIQSAVDIAKDSDVAVIVLGDNSKGGKCCGSQDEERLGYNKVAVTSGEGYDDSYLELHPAQVKLFNQVVATGKPVILVLYGGRPRAITDQVDKASAILFAFGGGEQTNESLTDILFGKVNPSGRLPISFPRSTGHIPCFYNYKPSARGRFYKKPGTLDRAGNDYVYSSPEPLFAFGYGLSYTSFVYDNIKVTKKTRHTFEISVDVKNVGDYDGDEVVLLFLSAKTQRITPMVKKLVAYKRINLVKNEKKTVKLTLSKDSFSYVGVDMKKTVAYTEFTATIEKQSVKFELV